MSETPAQAPATAAPSPSPTAAPTSTVPEVASIEAQMESARVAAEAQARQADATGIDPSITQRTEPASPATQADPSREPSTSDQAGEDEGDAPEDGADTSATPDPNTPPEQRWSRKDAPRLAAKVEELSKTTQELRTQLDDKQRTEGAALQRFASLVKTPDEYAQLQQKAINGDWEARQQLEVADAWRQMAAPIFALAQQQADQYVGRVEQAYKADHHKLTTLEGVDDAVLQKVVASQTPAETLRILYDAGRSAEQKASKGQITALETEVQDLRRQLAGRGPHPLGGNGSGGQLGSLASLVRADGTIDEATIQRAMNGDFIGVGVEKPSR